MNKPVNTPFQDVVLLIVDHPNKLNSKIDTYLRQGYRVAINPARFEDITIDTQMVGRSVADMPKGSILTVLTRLDPTP